MYLPLSAIYLRRLAIRVELVTQAGGRTRLADPVLSFFPAQAGSSAGYDLAYGVSAGADGSFFLAGLTTGSIDDETVNAGGYDFAAMKISGEDGSVLWSWQVRCALGAVASLGSTLVAVSAAL